MANRSLFRSLVGRLIPSANTVNEAGGVAYAFSPRHTLAQYAATGCLNSTYYADAASQLKTVLGDHWRLATIDATRIARETLGVPIVNTTMLGALIRASGAVNVESLYEPLKERFGRLAERNISAMKRAVEETAIEELH